MIDKQSNGCDKQDFNKILVIDEKKQSKYLFCCCCLRHTLIFFGNKNTQLHVMMVYILQHAITICNTMYHSNLSLRKWTHRSKQTIFLFVRFICNR
jgi:hypothetical protein